MVYQMDVGGSITKTSRSRLGDIMGVKITQPGEAKAAAETGAIVGKGRRAEKEEARAERERARTQQIAAQQAARKAALDWEQKKMQMRSEQDFQQELAAKQWDYEKFNRAKAWELDKLEMRSRIDFEKEEQERSRKIDKFNLGIESIDKALISDEQKIRAKRDWALRYADVPKAAQYLGLPREYAPGREPTFAQRKAAAKYLEETELGWKERYMPGFLGGKELTETEQQLRAEAEGILTGSVAEEINIRPESEADFINTVRQLKAVDVNRAKQYYDRYAGGF